MENLNQTNSNQAPSQPLPEPYLFGESALQLFDLLCSKTLQRAFPYIISNFSPFIFFPSPIQLGISLYHSSKAAPSHVTNDLHITIKHSETLRYRNQLTGRFMLPHELLPNSITLFQPLELALLSPVPESPDSSSLFLQCDNILVLCVQKQTLNVCLKLTRISEFKTPTAHSTFSFGSWV